MCKNQLPLLYAEPVVKSAECWADSIEEGWREKNRQKVVSSIWGADFMQFLAALAVLLRSIWKKRINSSFSFK